MFTIRSLFVVAAVLLVGLVACPAADAGGGLVFGQFVAPAPIVVQPLAVAAPAVVVPSCQQGCPQAFVAPAAIATPRVFVQRAPRRFVQRIRF